MTSRRKSRRVEVLQEVQGDVRRSPRLRERYSRERSEGASSLTVMYTATSRQGLSGYLRQKELEEQNGSILNESGQSVPSYFDLGQDNAASKHAGETEMGYLLHYSPDTPDPQHLYGLDGSEDEEDGAEQRYHERPGIPSTPSATRGSSGVVGWMVSGMMGLLFRLGSLLYLAATAILCLDVIILHRCYLVLTAITCWSSHAAAKPWLRFWILPVVLCSLVAALIGGGLVPVTEESPQYNITNIDVTKLHSELLSSIKSTLSEDVRRHVEEHMDKVVKQWVEKRIKTELDLTNTALNELKTNFTVEILRMQTDMMAELEKRLGEVWNQTQSTYITSTVMMQTLQVQIEQHLDTAKQQWMKLIEQDISTVTGFVNQLRDDVEKKDQYYSEQLLSLEKLIGSNNSTITETLLQLISDLQASATTVAGLTSGVESQSRQLASLEVEVRRVSVAVEEVSENLTRRLEEVEGAGLSDEDMARVFAEEMDKSVENTSSVLWVWLSKELKKVVQEREIPASGLTKMDVIELIKIALHKYSADRIAKFDFALENSGGGVVHSSNTYPPALETYRVMGVPLWTVPSCPKTIIQPGVHPGDCWAMDGTSGYALIRLKEAVAVTGVTVEHIPKELTPSGSLSSAPKEFRILGKNETEHVTEGDVLGEFTYSIDSIPIQEFPVEDNGKAYTHILFDFLSNHGNEFYTCVYRVRVHGYPVDTQVHS
jgi:SUN domain-containing protein 1/2